MGVVYFSGEAEIIGIHGLPADHVGNLKIRVETGILISYDQLVLAPILSQMIDSFAEIADLVDSSFGLYTNGIFSFWLKADLSWMERQLEVTGL